MPHERQEDDHVGLGHPEKPEDPRAHRADHREGGQSHEGGVEPPGRAVVERHEPERCVLGASTTRAPTAARRTRTTAPSAARSTWRLGTCVGYSARNTARAPRPNSARAARPGRRGAACAGPLPGAQVTRLSRSRRLTSRTAQTPSSSRPHPTAAMTRNRPSVRRGRPGSPSRSFARHGRRHVGKVARRGYEVVEAAAELVQRARGRGEIPTAVGRRRRVDPPAHQGSDLGVAQVRQVAPDHLAGRIWRRRRAVGPQGSPGSRPREPDEEAHQQRDPANHAAILLCRAGPRHHAVGTSKTTGGQRSCELPGESIEASGPSRCRRPSRLAQHV